MFDFHFFDFDPWFYYESSISVYDQIGAIMYKLLKKQYVVCTYYTTIYLFFSIAMRVLANCYPK